MERKDKSHTFASAFEKQARERIKKEFFEKIYINREVVQEADMRAFRGLSVWVNKTSQFASIIKDTHLEQRQFTYTLYYIWGLGKKIFLQWRV